MFERRKTLNVNIIGSPLESVLPAYLPSVLIAGLHQEPHGDGLHRAEPAQRALLGARHPQLPVQRARGGAQGAQLARCV